MKFVELSDGMLVNVEQIIRAVDITKTGYYRVFMHNGSKIDLGPKDSEALKRTLIPKRRTKAPTT